MKRALLLLAVVCSVVLLAGSLAGCAISGSKSSTTLGETTTTGSGETASTVPGETTTLGPGETTGVSDTTGETTGAGDTTATDGTATSLGGSTGTSLETSTTLATTETTEVTAAGFSSITHEQNDSRFAYSGSWSAVTSASASGGSYRVADSSGASVTIRFVGTRLAWIAKKSPAYGEADVSVDGGAGHVVDLYSAKVAWKQTVWQSGTLSEGSHTVIIKWAGKKRTAATGKSVDVDAVAITGVATGLYQQSDSKFVYSGSWKGSSNASASGGSFVYANKAGASVTVHFDGIELVWIAKEGSSYGKAKITVDGGKTVEVDLYHAGSVWQRRVWSTGILTSGSHTVKIECAGTKRAGATGTYIDVDAFEVTGSL